MDMDGAMLEEAPAKPDLAKPAPLKRPSPKRQPQHPHQHQPLHLTRRSAFNEGRGRRILELLIEKRKENVSDLRKSETIHGALQN